MGEELSNRLRGTVLRPVSVLTPLSLQQSCEAGTTVIVSHSHKRGWLVERSTLPGSMGSGSRAAARNEALASGRRLPPTRPQHLSVELEVLLCGSMGASRSGRKRHHSSLCSGLPRALWFLLFNFKCAVFFPRYIWKTPETFSLFLKKKMFLSQNKNREGRRSGEVGECQRASPPLSVSGLFWLWVHCPRHQPHLAGPLPAGDPSREAPLPPLQPWGPGRQWLISHCLTVSLGFPVGLSTVQPIACFKIPL